MWTVVVDTPTYFSAQPADNAGHALDIMIKARSAHEGPGHIEIRFGQTLVACEYLVERGV